MLSLTLLLLLASPQAMLPPDTGPVTDNWFGGLRHVQLLEVTDEAITFATAHKSVEPSGGILALYRVPAGDGGAETWQSLSAPLRHVVFPDFLLPDETLVGDPNYKERNGRTVCFSSTGDAESSQQVWTTGEFLARFGHSRALVQDLDGDLVPDVAVGSPGAMWGSAAVHSMRTGKIIAELHPHGAGAAPLPRSGAGLQNHRGRQTARRPAPRVELGGTPVMNDR